ncbi:MAG: histidine kinase dimerization/phospho-acceptor domain-containing protein [archaeon]
MKNITEHMLKEEVKEIVNQVGHYLKTPLTSIQGFTQLLQDDENIINDPVKRELYLDIINKNSIRLNSAIADVQNSLWLFLYGKEVKEDE